MSPEFWIQITVTVLGAGGGAWVGLKTSVNGMREQVKETNRAVQRIEGKVDDLVPRVAVLESKVEAGN